MKRKNYYLPVMVLLLLACQMAAFSQDAWQRLHKRPSELQLDQPTMKLETPSFMLNLVSSSQTVASLRPRSLPEFDYTPGDSLQARSGNGMYHIGDINLRLRMADSRSEWQEFSTA